MTINVYSDCKCQCWVVEERREYDCCSCISLHIPNVVRGCLGRVGRRSYTNTSTIPAIFCFFTCAHPARFNLGQIVDIDWCLAESAGPSLAMMLPKGSIAKVAHGNNSPGSIFSKKKTSWKRFKTYVLVKPIENRNHNNLGFFFG